MRYRRVLRWTVDYLKADTPGRGVLKRSRFFDLSRQVTPVVGVDAPEGLLLVRTDDIDLGKETFVGGAWDRDVVEFAVKSAQELSGRQLKGRTVVEIGANVGTTTLLLLTRYEAAHIVAFEPVPKTVRLLRAMVALNGLEGQVDVRPIALTDAPGSLQMELSPRSAGDNRVRSGLPVDSRQGEAERELTEVLGTTFDAEMDDLSEVALVWMDAQGHEGHVLAGAKRLLTSEVPVITEFWPYALKRGEGLETFLSLVEQHYGRVFDTAHGDPQRARMYPADAIRSLVGRYPGPDDFTDLILLK
jgi:FkbM family methyltransferase